MPNDYEEFVEKETPKVAELAKLKTLVDMAHRLDAQAARHADDLKAAQKQLGLILSRDIPNLMRELGLEEFKNKDGLHITVKEDIQAGITEANKDAALKWLEDNGHGGLIKRDIIVSFNRDQEAEAAAAAATLKARFAAVTEKKGVHPSTIKAWAREQLESGKEVPIETFSVFRQKVAKISQTNKKK